MSKSRLLFGLCVALLVGVLVPFAQAGSGSGKGTENLTKEELVELQLYLTYLKQQGRLAEILQQQGNASVATELPPPPPPEKPSPPPPPPR